MPTAPLPPVARPRLLARLAAARAVIVEAGGGHGKSTLLDEAAAAAGVAVVRLDLGGVAAGASPVLGVLRRAVRAAGMGGLEAALAELGGEDEAALADEAARAVAEELAARGDPVLVVIDDAGAPAGEGVRLVAGIVGAVAGAVAGDRAVAGGGPAAVEGAVAGPGALSSDPAGPGASHRVLVAGRSVPPAVVAAAPGAVLLGAPDLALTPDEVEALGRAAGRPVDAVTAAGIAARTAGWPAAVGLALAVGSGRAAGGGASGDGVGAALDALLASAGPETSRAAAALATLPRFDARIAAIAAGAGALDRVIAAGVPVRERADGWLELPDPIRGLLAGRVPAVVPVRAVAEAYLDAGWPALALAYLAGAGEPDALAETLERRPWHELSVLDAGELRAAIASLPADAVERHPRVLLAAARVAEAGVHLGWRGRLLERAASLPATDADPVLRREVLAERAADASRSGDEERAVALAEEVLDGAGPGEGRSRAVALTALGRLGAFSRDPAGMIAAVDQLTEAAALLRPLGEPELLRAALGVLGYGIHFARGDLDAAVTALREAADLEPGAIRTRAGTQTFLADALLARGDLDEAEAVLRDELGVARRLRDHRLLGYHAWMQASIASRRGDAPAVEAWLAEAERHPADWFAHPTGIEFLAEGVDHLGRVGLHAEAGRMLARVEARCAADGRPGVDQIALVARAIHGARAGDPVTAEQDLVACLSMEQVPPREHWRIHLLRGLAAARAGDGAAARRHARRAFEAARAMGHPDLPRLLEPGIAAQLAPLLAGDAADAATQPSPGDEAAPPTAFQARIRVLGRFEVWLDGRRVDPPDGRPSQLVKLLAVAGRLVPIDEAVEVLWPDADPDLGRQRLRNVIARVRAAAGDLVVRDDEALGLAAWADVDLVRFEAEARAALDAPAAAQEPLVRAALARYAGELLPADRYEEFAAAARERATMRHLALLDRLAVLTAARGDIDEALAVLEEAIAAEPLDDHRYRVAIDIALAHGRRDRATRLVERALAMEQELAGEPSAELLAQARVLGIVAAGPSGTGVVRRGGTMGA
ncbi:MAG: tetratricopeptide repeat protein [Chloroflexota bacterium]